MLAVLISYVLRLAPSALDDGHVAGYVEHVQTGVKVAFSSADELLAALVPLQRGDDAGPRQIRRT